MGKRARQPGGMAFRDRGLNSRLSCPYGASLFLGEIGIDGRLYAGVEVFGRNGLF